MTNRAQNRTANPSHADDTIPEQLGNPCRACECRARSGSHFGRHRWVTVHLAAARLATAVDKEWQMVHVERFQPKSNSDALF